MFDLTSTKKAAGPQPFGFMRWSATDGIRERHNPVHLLGSCPGVGFEVPPGKRYAMVLAIGSYLESPVTTGLDGRYLYTRYYEDLTDVLRSTLDKADALMAAAEALDAKLDAAPLSDDQRFMIAHATHSYYGSTQLLEIDRKPFWVVNEGEYCMMNTLDLAVDHVFWELDRNPWLVRNLLDNFVRLYSYTDEIKVYKAEAALSSHAMDHDPSQPPPPPDAAQLARPYDKKPGGISFCPRHGRAQQLRAQGAFELRARQPDLHLQLHDRGAALQLDAHRRLLHGEDARHGVAQEEQEGHQGLPDEHGQPRRRGRLRAVRLDEDGGRPGDHDLRLARPLAGADAQQRLHGRQELGDLSRAGADVPRSRRQGDTGRSAGSWPRRSRVSSPSRRWTACFPPSSRSRTPATHSRILPAVEGCAYPLYFVKTGYQRQTLEQVFGTPAEKKMYDVLKEHTRKLLLDPQRRNVFADGGIKLSSTSNNSWMSKISIFMHVTRRVFHLDQDPGVVEVFRKADAAHVKWQVEGSAYWACSDQIVSGEGKASRYYPRIITSALWME